MARRITEREAQVLQLVGHGLSNDQIADELGLSARTVANHLQNAFEKLEVNDRRSAYHRLVIRYPEYEIPIGVAASSRSNPAVEQAPIPDQRDTEGRPSATLYDHYAQLGNLRTPGLTGIGKSSLILRVAGLGLLLLAALAGLISVFQIFDPGSA
jgi:DNA-binding CsgD family transcriptional regulator